MPKIVVSSVSFAQNPTLCAELLKIFPDAQFSDVYGDADGIIVGTESINEPCPNLKIIAKYGVGLDNIDVEEYQKRGVAVAWEPGANKYSVAELTITLMIMLCRNIFVAASDLKNGKWNRLTGSQLSGKTVGIIGAGHIGKEVIRLLEPFGCPLLINDIADPESVEKEWVFKNADIVTIHTPLTALTRYMITKKTLSVMKPTAYLINTARGKVVNQADLKWALQNQIIAGAALDVFETEPPTDTKFLSLPNLICTPHIGANAIEAKLNMGRAAIQHLRQFFKV